MIALAQARGIEVVERAIEPADFADTTEVFLTGTAAEVTPVGEIDEYRFTPGKVTAQMIEDYEKAVGKTDAGAGKEAAAV